MLFSESQIKQVMEIVDFQHLHFCIFNIGTSFLTIEDKSLLKKYGIDIDKIELPKMSSSRKAFLFGRLASALRDQTGKINYNDFTKYLRRGQYIPLNRAEENILNLLENNLVDYVKKESSKIKEDIKSLLDDRNTQWELKKTFDQIDIVKKETRKAVLENRSKQDLYLEIGNKTGLWEKDLGRIAETELQNIYQYGKLAAYAEETNDKEDLLVYKKVFPGACKHCINLYLTNGIGSQPIIFKMSELIANGTNIGKRPANWKAVVGTVHPFCRCELEKYIKGDIWDQEKRTFTLPKTRVDEARNLPGKIIIKIGDKQIST